MSQMPCTQLAAVLVARADDFDPAAISCGAEKLPPDGRREIIICEPPQWYIPG